jgi:uncharacterized membrane protein
VSLAPYHPQVVHFVIALLIVGVVFRLVSLTRRFTFTSPAATTLILLGTLASFVAVRSGEDAHGPVERVPGARQAVVEHEAWGEHARNAFVLLSLVELGALMLRWRNHRYAGAATIAAAVAGVASLLPLYETAEHGGELVYGYAGGVGLRSGDPADVNRLYIAGVYHQAMQDREAVRGLEGADLVDRAAQRFPDHLELQLMAIEWTTDVRKDPGTALQRLESVQIPRDDARLRVRAGLGRARALEAQGNVEGARRAADITGGVPGEPRDPAASGPARQTRATVRCRDPAETLTLPAPGARPPEDLANATANGTAAGRQPRAAGQ